MAFDFTGKTAIVTGGTQGIGLEIAKGIVAGGGHVALIARNAAKGEAAVARPRAVLRAHLHHADDAG